MNVLAWAKYGVSIHLSHRRLGALCKHSFLWYCLAAESLETDDFAYSWNIIFLFSTELTISTNSSRALASNLAATNERSNKTLASRTNKLYFALNNEKSSATSTSQYHRAPTVNTIPVDGPNHSRTHLLRRQPQSSTPMTFNKDRTTTTTKKQETRNYSNHERLPMQTSPLLKATIPKPATFIPRPPRVRHILHSWISILLSLPR